CARKTESDFRNRQSRSASNWLQDTSIPCPHVAAQRVERRFGLGCGRFAAVTSRQENRAIGGQMGALWADLILLRSHRGSLADDGRRFRPDGVIAPLARERGLPAIGRVVKVESVE